MTGLIIGILFSYLLGSIPTGYLFGKFVKGIDIREHGSGNLGATNVFRVLGVNWGILTLILDILKGFAAVTLISQFFFVENIFTIQDYEVICGFFAIVGHIWTIFLGFKGGKGVATSTGVFFGICWQAALTVLLIFLIVLWLSRYVSLSSICAAIALPIFIKIFSDVKVYLIVSMVLSVIIVIKHKPNIKRLILGTENRVGRKR